MGRRNRREITAQLVAAIYERGKQAKSFSTSALADELRVHLAADREWISGKMYQWKKAGMFRELPRTGMAQLFELSSDGLRQFAPPPPPVAEPLTPSQTSSRGAEPVTLDTILRGWLSEAVGPFGSMLKAAVQEIQRLRSDVDALLELASRPEGEREPIERAAPAPTPLYPNEPAPNLNTMVTVAPEAKAFKPAYSVVPPTPPKLALDETALAVVVGRLSGWIATPNACRDFEKLDAFTQGRVVRVLRAASQMPDAWPKLGKRFGTAGQIPAAYRRAGTWWSFRAGKKDRVMVRRNGSHTVVEALVKRNDHRWYSSEK